MPGVKNPEFIAAFQQTRRDLATLGFYHSIELPNGSVIPGLQTIDQQRWRIAQFPIPQDLHGKRVLDIGAWDGWFSFEMERRGAEVVAVDSTKDTRFLEAKRMLHSKVEHVVADICYLTPRDIGYFDIVLFFGVLYHVKHPILALERVCELTTDLACIESFVTDDQPTGTTPTMEFYEGAQLADQFDNWMGPNISCLMAMCRTAGFARVDFKSAANSRAHVICHRKWPEIARSGAGPVLFDVENSQSRNHSFTAHRDDYITTWMHSEEPDLTCDDVFVQVGPYGTRPAALSHRGPTWQANCKLPLGLAPGWHEVSVAVRASEFSRPVRIAVDLPREARVGTPLLIAVENSESQNHNFSAHGDEYFTASISSEELDLGCNDIVVKVGSYSCMPEDVRRVGGTWRANCKMPPGLTPAWYDVSVKVRDSMWSNRARIAVDLPREARVCSPTDAFEISVVCDGRTWERNQVRAGLGSCVSAWVAGLSADIERSEVSFRLDGTDLPACFLSPLDEKGPRQINAMLPPGLDLGQYHLTVRCREEESREVLIQLF